MNIEIISIPVSNQERAGSFYEKIGFEKKKDNSFGEEMRWLEYSLCGETSITIVNWFPEMPPGSIHGLILKVDDIEAKRIELIEKGVEIEPIFDTPWGRFANFSDPDGNGWSLRESA